MILHTKEYYLIEYNKIVNNNHRGHIVDVNIKDLINNIVNNINIANRSYLDLVRKSHRDWFVKLVKERLDIILIIILIWYND